MSFLKQASYLSEMCSNICLEAVVKNRWKAIHFFLSFDVFSAVKHFPSFEEKALDENTPMHNGPNKFLGCWGGVPCYLTLGHSDVMILVSVD